MSLKLALLGLIALEPRSGYDIKGIINSSIHFIWSVTGPQIYTTLRTLRDDGLITTEVIPQQGKPDKQIHSITANGQIELERLANQRINATITRDEILLQIFFGNFADPDVMRTELALFLERMQQEREFMEGTQARVLAKPGTRYKARRFQLLSLRLKVAQWRAMEAELQAFLAEETDSQPASPKSKNKSNRKGTADVS